MSVIPFSFDLQPATQAVQSTTKSYDANRSDRNSSSFSSILSSVVKPATTKDATTKDATATSSTSPKSAKNAEDETKNDQTEPTASIQPNLLSTMGLIVPQQNAPATDSTVVAADGQNTTAVSSITATSQANNLPQLAMIASDGTATKQQQPTTAVDLTALLTKATVQGQKQELNPPTTATLPQSQSANAQSPLQQTPTAPTQVSVQVSTDTISQKVADLTAKIPFTVPLIKVTAAATAPINCQPTANEVTPDNTGQTVAAIVPEVAQDQQPQTTTAKLSTNVVGALTASLADPKAAPPPQTATATTNVAIQENLMPTATGQSSTSHNNTGNQTLLAESSASTTTTALEQDTTTANSALFSGILQQQVAKPNEISQSSTTQSSTATDPNNIAGQIIEQARLITSPQNSEMIIKLKPEHLGELTMRIVVDNGVVSASFHSSNPEVRGAIEATLNQLRQDMTNQGLKVNDVGVYSSLSQFTPNDQRGYQQQQQQQLKNNETPRLASQEFVDAVDAASVSRSLSPTTAIDYRI